MVRGPELPAHGPELLVRGPEPADPEPLGPEPRASWPWNSPPGGVGRSCVPSPAGRSPDRDVRLARPSPDRLPEPRRPWCGGPPVFSCHVRLADGPGFPGTAGRPPEHRRPVPTPTSDTGARCGHRPRAPTPPTGIGPAPARSDVRPGSCPTGRPGRIRARPGPYDLISGPQRPAGPIRAATSLPDPRPHGKRRTVSGTAPGTCATGGSDRPRRDDHRAPVTEPARTVSFHQNTAGPARGRPSAVTPG